MNPRPHWLLALAVVAGCSSPVSDAADAALSDTSPGEVSAPDTFEPADTEMPVDSRWGDDAPDVGADTGDDAADTDVPVLDWPALPETAPCARDEGAPMLDDALAPAALTADTLVYDDEQLSRSTKYYAGGLLDDPFLLSWQRPTLWAPTRASCFIDASARQLDGAAAGAHPVSGLIRVSASMIERWPEGGPTPARSAVDLPGAIAEACAAAGESCTPDTADLPDDLQAALVPLVLAIADGIAARRGQDLAAPPITGGWVESGGLGTSVFAPYGALDDADVRDFLVGAETRPALNLAAARVAYAIESVDWASFRDRSDIPMIAIPTPIGWLRVGTAGDDLWPADLGETWLLVDVGGDDVYLNDVGATARASRGVNVAIDLGGSDLYAYPEAVAPEADLDAALPPADSDGRYAGDASYGRLTLSKHGRQGAGRHGIGMLFDLGGDSDTYRSLSQSQGYAHVGVGVLFDDGGDDLYVSEQASQADAAYGIALLVDLGGADRYRIFSHGQGAGEPHGVGVLYDAAGDDDYRAEAGDADAGTVLYLSPQMPGAANNSAAQGAGLGIRWDDHGVFLSGGLGVLRDVAGDDRYLCGLFCQGSGFWQGTGALADGDGADHYDGLWYVQGGAAHYAIGALTDGGAGGDVFNATLTPRHVQLGAGHDFSLGLLVNDRGDDTYGFASLSLGAGNCNGVGLFVDNGGDDVYMTTAPGSAGYAALGECAADPDRPLSRTVGVLLDAGGSDSWTYPADEVSAPGDDARWGRQQTGAETEIGVGLDGAGETGIMAP